MSKIENLLSPNGNPVPNQLKIIDEDGVTFQSYSTVIAKRYLDGRIVLDAESWNYSKTTAKYRNQFLSETTRETEQKIESGEYALANLNA